MTFIKKTPEELREDRLAGVLLILFLVSLLACSVAFIYSCYDEAKVSTKPAAPVFSDVVCFDNWGASKRFPTLVSAVRNGVVWHMTYSTGEVGAYVQLPGESCWAETSPRKDNKAHRPIIK